MSISTTSTIKVETADPSSLALFGLAIVTLVASTQKLGITDGVSFIIPWAIFLGGGAQLFGCIGDFKRNNVFGATAFGAYAMFWWSVALTWLIKMGLFGVEMAKSADIKQLGYAFLGYLIFSLVMTVGSAKNNKVLFSIFVAIDFLFIGLSLSILSSGTLAHFGHTVAAFAELACSLLSFYLCAAAVLNPHFGRVVLPTGKAFLH
ncbi:MAG: acetate uptake transporter [Sulfurospirillaceae bacterium]|nr:acetate uptake transporter [Sulfurospirillaceae bacterium]